VAAVVVAEDARPGRHAVIGRTGDGRLICAKQGTDCIYLSLDRPKRDGLRPGQESAEHKFRLRLGRSPSTVKAYFNDAIGEKAKAVKARYQGLCRGCGAPTQPRNGKGDAYAYCKACHPSSRAATAARTPPSSSAHGLPSSACTGAGNGWPVAVSPARRSWSAARERSPGSYGRSPRRALASAARREAGRSTREGHASGRAIVSNDVSNEPGIRDG
jgi:hypothetical protein